MGSSNSVKTKRPERGRGMKLKACVFTVGFLYHFVDVENEKVCKKQKDAAGSKPQIIRVSNLVRHLKAV